MIRLFCFAAFAVALMGVAAPSLATVFSYSASLSGPAEFPANLSPGTGTALVDYDNVAHTLRVQVTFSGLLGNVTASHIHSATAVPGTGTAGVATTTPTFTGFPSGVTSGTYDHTFDMTLSSSWNAAFITNNGGTPASAEAALASGLAAGKAYLNIHTSQFGGGEIRGFLVPEPGTLVLAAAGALALLPLRRRRK